MLLIDGHNLLGKSLGFADEEAGRMRLVSLIASRLAHKRERVVVVFDGDRPLGNSEPAPGSIRVHYTGRGKTADDELIRLVDTQDPRNVTLVTSDAELASRAKVRGVKVQKSEEFLASKPQKKRAPEAKPNPSAEDAEFWLAKFKK